MAFPKPINFPEFDQHVGYINRVLGYPARTYILRLLHMNGELEFQDLASMLPLVEGTITEHLRKLRMAGLIRVEERGLVNIYSVDLSGLDKACQLQREFMKELEVSGAIEEYTDHFRGVVGTGSIK